MRLCCNGSYFRFHTIEFVRIILRTAVFVSVTFTPDLFHSPSCQNRYWRSYSQDNIVQSHFSTSAVNYSVVGDSKTFARQMLLSQLAAALQMKQQIETFRATNTFGTLIWQLGEIFPTGGWGSLEYAHAFAGTPGLFSLLFRQFCVCSRDCRADSWRAVEATALHA